MKKIGLTRKETGRLTLRLFNRLYRHYKDDFDAELRMTRAGVTYDDLRREEQASEEWL